MVLDQWAADWRIPPEALVDLRRRLGCEPPPPPPNARSKSESWAQTEVRLEASLKGMKLWRNNVGALLDQRGVPVRYGLANDSKQLNERIKSADLIGIKPVLITQAHVGATIGQFLSREMKHPGWSYCGDPHERAQLAWAKLVVSLGGDAGFATGKGSL